MPAMHKARDPTAILTPSSACVTVLVTVCVLLLPTCFTSQCHGMYCPRDDGWTLIISMGTLFSVCVYTVMTVSL